MSRYSICVAILAWSCAPDTTEVDRLVERGRILYLNGEYDAAIDSLNRAVALDDSRVLAYLYLSRAHLRLNRHEEAGRAVAEALELDPDRPSLYEVLGNIHVSRYTAFAYTETGEADLEAARRREQELAQALNEARERASAPPTPDPANRISPAEMAALQTRMAQAEAELDAAHARGLRAGLRHQFRGREQERGQRRRLSRRLAEEGSRLPAAARVADAVPGLRGGLRRALPGVRRESP